MNLWPRSARPPRPWIVLLFALVLAYGAGGWLVLLHHTAGIAEGYEEPPLVLHWLRDASLAFPAVLAGVWLALVLAHRALARVEQGPLDDAFVAGAAAVAASGALGAGSPVHGLLFGTADAHHSSLFVHALTDGLLALVVGLPLAGIVAALALPAAAPRPSLRGRALVVLAAVTVGGATGWQAYAEMQDRSLLSDEVGPCFDDSPVARPFSALMPIPPVKQGVPSPDASTDLYEIVERLGEAEIIPGITTPVWGYDGLVPGPTILARKGRPVRVTWVNNLPPGGDQGNIIVETEPDPEAHPFRRSSTVVHLHGLNTDPASDGYAEDRKDPGEAVTKRYPNNDYERPATLWYHDHSVHLTSEHVYRGLAGLYILTDQREDTLNLPKGYGVHDIPLVLKDLSIDPESGKLVYDNCSHMGAFGDVMTINGKQQPRFEVGTRKYRFRMLNASDSRQYLLALRRVENVGRETENDSGNEPFTLIGTDQGLLPAPEPIRSFHTTPSERHEFVIDFSRYPVGTRLVLVNLLVDASERKLFQIMAFDVTRAEPDESTIPAVVRPGEHLADAAAPVRTRRFEFVRQDGYWSIDGKQWDPNRVDAFPVLNTNEEWILVNGSGGWGHPVHIHLGRFRIVGIEGRAPNPGELNGFKDTVWVGPHQTIRVVHQFWNFTGRYVFHCHNGSHEDHDMMGQFEVVPG